MTTRGSYELNSGAISERKDERWKICVIIFSFIMITATIAVILWIHRSRITEGDCAGHECDNEDLQVPLFEQLKENVLTVTVDVTKSEPSTVTSLQTVTEARTEMVETTTMPTKNWIAVEKVTNAGTITEKTTTMLKPTARSTEKTTDETTVRQSTMEQKTVTRGIVWKIMKKQATETYVTSQRTTEMDRMTQQTTETQNPTDVPTTLQEMIQNRTDTQEMIAKTTVMQKTSEEIAEMQEKVKEITETQTSESPSTTGSSFELTEQIPEGTAETMEPETTMDWVADKRVETETSTSLDTTEHTTEKFGPTETTTVMPQTIMEIATVNLTTVAQDTYESDPCDEETENMRSHMNCKMSACDDFHSYACGAYGFDFEEQSVEMDINQRILNQANAHPNSPASKQLMDYYNSCLSYGDFDETARLELAAASLDEIGQFRLFNSSQVKFDLTDMLYKLLARDSAPLFDIDLEVDLVNPKELVFVLRPRLRKSELYVENEHQDCSIHVLFAEENSYEAALSEYMNCEHGHAVEEIEETLQKMEFRLQTTENVSTQILSRAQAADIGIDVDLNLYKPFLPEGVVHMAENYKRKRLSDWMKDLVDAEGSCLNLTRLLSNLSGKQVDESSILQIYSHERFLEAVGSICQEIKDSPAKINNAFLGLYVHHLYYQLVKPPLNQEDYCMKAVKTLLEPQASEFYMSSFTDEDLQKKNESVFAMFEELKETFRLEMNGIEWADELGREKVMEKFNSLSLIVPQTALYEKNGPLHSTTRWGDMILDSNFFDNTIQILKRKRELMYESWQKDPNAIEQIWTHFSVPYRTYAKSIYRLNSIVLPLGAVDWALSLYDTPTYNLKLATLGNLISREMARQFDEWGLKYYRGNEAGSSFFHNDEQARISYENYAHCHRTLSGELYELGVRTLNERLSDTVGLQLAYDTMMRMTSNSSTNINEEKRFFVAYAQMLCKRDRLPTSFWISLDAEEHLPASLRTSAVLSSTKHVGQAWRCDRGSATYPQSFCSVFPKINSPEQEILDPSRS